VDLDVDPDQISFTAVLALTRSSLAADTRCGHCAGRPAAIGDPGDILLAAITAQPLNRTGRQRTSPRTKAQRRTDRTRNVSYTIEIVASNLSKVE